MTTVHTAELDAELAQAVERGRILLGKMAEALQQAAAQAFPALKRVAEVLADALPHMAAAVALSQEIERQHRAWMRHLHTETSRRHRARRKRTHR